ncbi:hypothetical protein [Acuticoccus mangrovi]|nr:hypothetical protein [Acuticoccus mangrovi]
MPIVPLLVAAGMLGFVLVSFLPDVTGSGETTLGEVILAVVLLAAASSSVVVAVAGRWAGQRRSDMTRHLVDERPLGRGQDSLLLLQGGRSEAGGNGDGDGGADCTTLDERADEDGGVADTPVLPGTGAQPVVTDYPVFLAARFGRACDTRSREHLGMGPQPDFGEDPFREIEEALADEDDFAEHVLSLEIPPVTFEGVCQALSTVGYRRHGLQALDLASPSGTLAPSGRVRLAVTLEPPAAGGSPITLSATPSTADGGTEHLRVSCRDRRSDRMNIYVLGRDGWRKLGQPYAVR